MSSIKEKTVSFLKRYWLYILLALLILLVVTVSMRLNAYDTGLFTRGVIPVKP